MYRIETKYKIETKDNLFFTGTVKEQDNNSILLNTIRGEELILSKSDIVRARVITEGTEYGTKENDNLLEKTE